MIRRRRVARQSWLPRDTIVRIRGRDALAVALDKFVNRVFPRAGAGRDPRGTVDRVERVVPVNEEPAGTYTACGIASTVLAEFGLTVDWQIPDYTPVSDFTANGRPLDVLRSLAEPFNAVEATPVDFYVEGGTVRVAQRPMQLRRLLAATRVPPRRRDGWMSRRPS